MARYNEAGNRLTMTGEHRHGGIIRSLITGGFKGMWVGGLTGGVAGALGGATLGTLLCVALAPVTGGASLAAIPLVIGGAAAIGAGTGALAGGPIGSAIRGTRWFGETVGNGVKKVSGSSQDGQQQQRGGDGPGFLAAVVGAVLAGKGLKEGLMRWAGNGRDTGGGTQQGYDNGAPQQPGQEQFNGQQQPGQQQFNGQQPPAPQVQHVAGIPLREDGQLEITASQLADPNVRKQLEDYGKQMQNNRATLEKQAGALAKRGDVEGASKWIEAIKAGDERAAKPLQFDDSLQNGKGAFVIDPVQLANRGTMDHLQSVGDLEQVFKAEAFQKDLAELKGALRDVKQVGRDLRTGRTGEPVRQDGSPPNPEKARQEVNASSTRLSDVVERGTGTGTPAAVPNNTGKQSEGVSGRSA